MVTIPGWVFIRHFDSPGNDIQQVVVLKGNPEALANLASTQGRRQEKCVAFNTDGWMKSALVPREKWRRVYADSKQGLWVRSDALEALEWEFVKGFDSPGNDIRCVEDLAGNPSQLMHYVNCDIPECVAFNTNGWIKHSIRPKIEWYKFSDSASEGMWVKKTALDSLEWVFVPFFDSDGNDISRVAGTPAERRAVAVSLREKCVAYNTNGWMKHTLLPRDKWYKWTDNEREGLYVKRSVLERLGWEFFPYVDSPGNDFKCLSKWADDSSSLLRYINEREPTCAAFNTAGYLKMAVLPKDQWVHVTTSPFRGLWVRRRIVQQQQQQQQ
ncbi:hypothetical protein CBR_g23815 [Chara braunii]|uniref:Uncharacterized protein n=1 Tax=Chara braunii TaxID=69332 RepID=A0A388JVW3_CHABU|nr:hypothetical protein CBR_g23815 [Chara braunii]|eukprot:GBG61862.1 hypothetical protein CBR_g23815 [Chara braunii]